MNSLKHSMICAILTLKTGSRGVDQMKGKWIVCLTLLCMCLFTLPVSADMGPKPSVTLNFTGIDTPCYATLLSEEATTGPYSVCAPSKENAMYQPTDPDYEIYQAFVSYRDADGYYFLQYMGACSDETPFVWGYYPPQTFKILLYFPQTDRFAVSSLIYERDAFHSHYTVKVENESIQQVVSEQAVTTQRIYRTIKEIGTLVVRMALTIAIEIGIAFVFGYRKKQQILLIVGVNIVTQLLLNALLLLVNHTAGGAWAMVLYLPVECLIFLIEAAVYVFAIDHLVKQEREMHRAIWFAICANAASFMIGFGVSYVIPWIG